MTDTIRWGILGTGSIAAQFAEGLKALPDARLQAVGSRARSSADGFAAKFKAPDAHDTYEGLASNPNVDAIYVATPHVFHKDNTLLCLEHGKAVLCEKPFAINAADAGTMIESARSKDLFLMEAMWTHCFPAMEKLRDLLSEGAIGDVRILRANFCFRTGFDPGGRLLNPAMGGGALLDVGVYTVALARMVFNEDPVDVTAAAHIGETGVDEQCALTLRYENGALAVLTCAIRTNGPHDAIVIGTEGRIEVPPAFWQPDRIVLSTGKKDTEYAFERLGNGYSYEAAEVMECLRRGRKESPVMPLAKTESIMRTMDRAREKIGLRYPGE